MDLFITITIIVVIGALLIWAFVRQVKKGESGCGGCSSHSCGGSSSSCCSTPDKAQQDGRHSNGC